MPESVLDEQPKTAKEPVDQPAHEPKEEPIKEAPKEKTTEKRERTRARGGKKHIIIIAAIAAAAIAAVALLIFLIGKAANSEIAIFETDAVFISTKDNGETKYALFKKNGDKVTDFIYTQAGAFVNGYAYVKNADGKKGIIDHNGNMAVDFGEYEDITPRVGIYEVSKDNKNSLILGNGDELISEYRSYDYSSSAPYVVVKTEDDQYSLFNALGDKLEDFESSESPYFTDDGQDTASALSYKGGLIILSNKNFKPIKTIETGVSYDIDEANKDATIITFVEHDKSYSDDAKRALFSKEFVDLGSQCADLDLHDNFTDKARIYLTCEKDNKNYLIRKNAVTDIEVNSYGTGYVVYDEDHYARYNSEDKKVDIFVNGESKKTLDSDYRVSFSTKGYTINNYRAKSVTLYDIEGNEVYALKDTSSSSELTGIDSNDNIVVRDGKQDSDKRYVLIDKDGKELSGRYNSIVAHDEYYSAYTKDGKTDLLNKNGEVVVSGDYDELDYYDEGKVILGKKGDYANRQYDLIDGKDKKVKATFDGTASYYKLGYIRVAKDKKVSFYTLDGKEMHSYEEK